MPYTACDSCERVFIISQEVDAPGKCPTCSGALRPLTAEEGRAFFLQLPVRRSAAVPLPAKPERETL